MPENSEVKVLQQALDEARKELAQLVEFTEYKLAHHEGLAEGNARQIPVIVEQVPLGPGSIILQNENLLRGAEAFERLKTVLLQMVTEVAQEVSPDKLAEILLRAGLFDDEYYLLVNKDVAEHAINPINHYVNYGIKEERMPSGVLNWPISL